MNLIVPHSWLKEFCKTKLSPETIAKRVSLSGPSIDRVVKAEDGDTLYEAEITTNRPDAFSIIGFAREVAAILGLPFDEPLDRAKLIAHQKTIPQKRFGKLSRLSVRIDASDLCSRYVGLMIDGVTVAPSPAWMQKRLLASGQRPINAVVDVTNYVMLEYGQPLHAFDADVVGGADDAKEIIIRKAKKGEQCTTLDGETKKLDSSMLVIADAHGPLALAGIKGGARGGIRETTKKIILEAAHFDAVNVRKTSRAVDIRTDSSSRFEKNLARELPPYAILRAAELICEISGGVLASPIVDCYPKKALQTTIQFSPDEATRILGVPFSPKECAHALSRLGFGVRASGKKFAVRVPFWREGDVENGRDLVEEAGRLYGYDRIPIESISGSLPLESRDPLFFWESRTKHFLKDRGWTEVMNYSFVPKNLLEKAGLEPSSAAVSVSNPLSLEFECMRPTLMPSMLETVAENEQKADALALFEFSKVYLPKKSGTLPDERLMLSGALMIKKSGPELFRSMKGSLAALFSEWFSSGASVSFRPMSAKSLLFERSGGVSLEVNGISLGSAGIVSFSRASAFGIKNPCAVFEIDISAASAFFTTAKRYVPIPKYPSIERDIAVIISKKYAYENVKNAVYSVDPLVTDMTLFDVFESAKATGAGRHSLAFRLTYASQKRTLTALEVDRVHEKVRAMLQEKFEAELR